MYKLLKKDPQLRDFEKDIALRVENYQKKLQALCSEGSLSDFANGHKFFGFHKVTGGWVYREWAPAAEKLYLTGDFLRLGSVCVSYEAAGKRCF